MAPLAPSDQNRVVEIVNQSLPVDPNSPIDTSTLAGKTILLTGGSSGLGAGFARRWASHGANLIIGDINDEAGTALVAELRTIRRTGHADDDQSKNHHFIHVDVTDWASQVHLFQEAVRLSPTGGLDAVVSSAGVSDKEGAITGRGFENPAGLDQPNPPPPSLKCIEVNLIGTMYTAHLALFWLQKNGTTGEGQGQGGERDRHLLLIGSSAGLSTLPGVPEYITSKHGVTGLFRSLRFLSYRQGIRVNMLCPYFVDTPILPNRALAMLAGLGTASMDDTIDAATRFMVTGPVKISGRALLVGPKMSLLRKVLPDHEVDGTEEADEELTGDIVVEEDFKQGKGQAVWEVYAHDYDSVDFFIRRYIRLLNTIASIKGWIGWWKEFYYALFVRKDPASARKRT